MSNFFYPNQSPIHDPRRVYPTPDPRSYSPLHAYPSSLHPSPHYPENRPIHGYPGHGDQMGYERRRDISPMRYGGMEDQRQYEYRNIPLQEQRYWKDLLRVLRANNDSGYQVEGYGGSPIRNSKELSPLIRLTLSLCHFLPKKKFKVSAQMTMGQVAEKGLMKGHEGSPIGMQQQRHYLEGANSWDKLIRRPVETKIERYHKIENWKKELDVQIQEQKVKKQVEEEERRNQKIKDENRYNRQLEELITKNRDLQKKKMADKPIKASGQYNEGGRKGWVQPSGGLLRPDYYLHPGYAGGGHHGEVNEKRGKSLQKHGGHYSMEIDDDRPRQRINGFIDNLKAEIIQGQKVFMDGIKDVRYNHKKTDRFRNLAERNLLGAQNGGIVRGGAFLKPDYIAQDESYAPSLESNRQHRRHGGGYQDTFESSQQLTRFVEPVDKYKEDADQFFDQLSNLKHGGGAADKSKTMKAKKPSVKQLEPAYDGGTAPMMEKTEKKNWSNNFNIVKETKLKVQDKVVKKETSVTSMKVENQIETQKEEEPVQKVEAKVETKEEDLQDVEEEIKEDKNDKEKEKSEFEESMKINQQIGKDMHLNKEDQASSNPVAEGEKLKTKESTKPSRMNTPSLAQLEKTETPSLSSMAGLPLPPREQTPMENRKINNFNLFKNSRRGSVETVDLDAFEHLLEKEVKRGKVPTFKSPREETELLFEGFSLSSKKDGLRGKKAKKSITIKSGVTLRALAQVITNDEVELRNFQRKKADPMAKLDSMLDRLFG